MPTIQQLVRKGRQSKRRKEAKEQERAEGEQEGGLDEENEENDDDEPQGLFSVKKKPDSSGAIYEVALPWTSFPLFKTAPPHPPGSISDSASC